MPVDVSGVSLKFTKKALSMSFSGFKTYLYTKGLHDCLHVIHSWAAGRGVRFISSIPRTDVKLSIFSELNGGPLSDLYLSGLPNKS